MIRALRRFLTDTEALADKGLGAESLVDQGLVDQGLAEQGVVDQGLADTTAATAVEYALVAGGIALVIVAAVNLLGATLLVGYTDLATKLN